MTEKTPGHQLFNHPMISAFPQTESALFSQPRNIAGTGVAVVGECSEAFSDVA
jgi:hypothetical protein